MPSFIIAMKGESPDEQQTTNKSSAYGAHSNQSLKIKSNRESVSEQNATTFASTFVLFTTHSVRAARSRRIEMLHYMTHRTKN